MTRTAVGRALGGGLALTRAAFGVGFLADPERMGAGWVGPRAARKPQNEVYARAVGGRDLALGAGALSATARGDLGSARGWVLAQALSDAVDLGATLVARGKLPKSSFAFATAMAAGSTAVGVVASLLLREQPATSAGTP